MPMVVDELGSEVGGSIEHVNVWYGEYRGIMFEIKNWKMEGLSKFWKSSWVFYLKVLLEQFPEEDREKIKPYIYYTGYGTPLSVPRDDNPILNLEWHGGMTYSADETTPQFYPYTFLKFGCDYQHLWDEGKTYDIEGVQKEVQECIDSLFVLYPNLKTRAKLIEEFRDTFPGGKAGGLLKRYTKEGKELLDERDDSSND